MSQFHVIPYGKQSIDKHDEEAVLKALYADHLTQGPQIELFETKFAEYVGSKYALAVANGTAALHLSVLALGLRPGNRVITTPITFAASANCVLYAGGIVEFADIDPNTGLIDFQMVKQLVESKPRGYYSGIIPVDFAGLAVDLEAFHILAKEHGLWVIEDACHAPGGYFTDSQNKIQRCGNGQFADLAVFSFHPVKHIATGEGGMITTNNKALYDRLLKLRTHGITKDPAQLGNSHGGWYYEMQTLGFNYRIPDLLCALGSSQLKKADNGLKRRKEIAERYDKAFEQSTITPLTLQAQLHARGLSHAYHLYVIKTRRRLDLYNHLRSKNIYAQVHYIPVYTMPFYQTSGYASVKCVAAEQYYDQCLSIPMYPTLSEEEQTYVIDSILNFSKAI